MSSTTSQVLPVQLQAGHNEAWYFMRWQLGLKTDAASMTMCPAVKVDMVCLISGGNVSISGLLMDDSPGSPLCDESAFQGTRAQQEAQPWNFEALPFYDRTNASYGRTVLAEI